MAIHGALAFRIVEYFPKERVWKSPSHTTFVWPGQVVWAECLDCPLDEDGHILMQESCTCGIHATLWDDEFRAYMFNKNAVGLMVEALNTYWLHDYGFTAPGVQVARVVNISKFGQQFGQWQGSEEEYKRTLGVQQLTMMAAKQFFTPNLSIVDYETARMAVKLQWEKLGEKWPFDN